MLLLGDESPGSGDPGDDTVVELKPETNADGDSMAVMVSTDALRPNDGALGGRELKDDTDDVLRLDSDGGDAGVAGGVGAVGLVAADAPKSDSDGEDEMPPRPSRNRDAESACWVLAGCMFCWGRRAVGTIDGVAPANAAAAVAKSKGDMPNGAVLNIWNGCRAGRARPRLSVCMFIAAIVSGVIMGCWVVAAVPNVGTLGEVGTTPGLLVKLKCGRAGGMGEVGRLAPGTSAETLADRVVVNEASVPPRMSPSARKNGRRPDEKLAIKT